MPLIVMSGEMPT